MVYFSVVIISVKIIIWVLNENDNNDDIKRASIMLVEGRNSNIEEL